MSRTRRNLWSAFIGEALANRKYTAFAMKAMEEGLPEVAQIFLEVAGSETIHAVSHFKTLGEVKSTAENLRGVIEEESYEMATMYPRMLQEALEDGRPDAARSFRLAQEREGVHMRLFQQALAELGRSGVAGALEEPPPRPLEPEVAPPKAPLPDSPLVEQVRRELAHEKQRVAAAGRIREAIFGVQDGLISTAGLVAAVAGADLQNNLIIVAGLAGALAGAVSMAAGSFTSSKAEREVHLAEIAREAREMEEHPEEELAELIELYKMDGMSREEAEQMAERVASDRDVWLKTLVEKELGLNPDVPTDPAKNAATMGIFFVAGGAVPVLPFFFGSGVAALAASISLAVGALAFVGAAKARFVRKRLAAALLSGLEMMGIGVAAIGLGYVLGTFIPRLLGVE